jgi:pimeloyl-ACP methyl ester carboxylesterase
MPRALLIHGLSSNSTTWWRVAQAMKDDGWDVVTPDLRGHGTAPRQQSYALADYASDLPSGPWDLIAGHSLGGAIAVLLSGTTRRLALIDPVLEVRADEFDEIKQDQLNELLLTAESIRASKPDWSERDLDLKIAAVGQVDPAAVEATFNDNPTWNVLEKARELAVATLILGADPAVYTMLEPETAQALSRANPLVEYVMVEGAGHSVHRDRPAETIAMLRSFYQRE